MRLTTYTLLIIIFLTKISSAQVNIETFRNTANKEGFFGSLKGGLQLQSGNVEIKIFDISVDAHVKHNMHHLLLKVSHQKGYQDKSLFQNIGFGHFRYTIMYHKILGYEIFTQTEFDTFKSLSLRQLTGTGIRTELTFFKSLNINSGLGVMHDYEQLSSLETNKDFRINSYLVLNKIINDKNGSLFSVVIYYQPLMFDINDWRIKNEANLKTHIADLKETKIYIITSYTYLYDSRPPDDVITDDQVLKVSFNVDW
jgi:hypothetical protein